MAFNIWERWPWTSFQNLNLDWLMKAVKEAVTKAEEASESVGQFDARITTNTEAIEQLSDDMETISSPAHVLVSSELEARYRGNLVTGAQLLAMMQTHGDLPYVEYNGEVYMLDSASTAGDLRFSMAHTTLLGDVTLRHIMIPAQSSNAAYSITNIDGGGGSSGNVFAVTITQQAGGYVSDHTYAEIYSQLQAGRIPVLLVAQGSNPTVYQICGMGETGTRTLNGQSVACIRFSDPTWLVSSSNNVGVWTIDANNNVDHIADLKQLATLDTVYDNAVIYTGPQDLTAAEQAQVKQNLGISDGGGSSDFVLLRMDTNGQVYNGTTAITGTQINTLAATNKALFLWDEDNERLYTYTEQGTSAGQLDGTAEFVSPLSNGNGCYLVTVNAANNDSAFYENNVPFQNLRIAMASTDTAPTLDPNKLYVFPEMATLTPTLATPTYNTIANEYHFCFDSGATATVLTIPASILQPDGFTIEANMHYEISILEGAMTAQGWAVTP